MTDKDNTIRIDRIEAETIRVPILGTSPLIVHRFSDKAKRQMLAAMQAEGPEPKRRRDPDADYQAAFYRFHDGGYGFPVIAFKDATVSAARFYSRVTMTELRQYLYFRGVLGVDRQQLVRLEGEPCMREDVVRLPRNGTDLRYRPEFEKWSTTVDITFVTSALTRSSVLSLLDAGGMGVGVGEWRPEKNGDFGCFQIDPDRDVEVIS